jgi:hypothetical protein
MSRRAQPFLFLALSLAGALAAAAASTTPSAATTNPEITAGEVMTHIRYLASAELGGRGSGAPGNNRAGDYLANRFQSLGLQPAGEKASFFQNFPLFTGLKLGARNELTIHSQEGITRLRARQDFMPFLFTRNGSVTAPLIFAGYGISQPHLGYDDYQGLEVRGKIVVVLRYTPDGQKNGKFAPYAPLPYKTVIASNKGAVGILFVTGPDSGVGEDLGRLPFQSAPLDYGLPAAFIRREFLERLLRPHHTHLSELQGLMAGGTPRSFPLTGVRVSLRTQVDRQPGQTRNLLGLLPGSDLALRNEYIVVGAHYDHLGSESTASGTVIHPGADDNASGTAGLLELAQHFAAHRDRLGRSVLFIGFSGEEIGLIGSNYWTKHPTIPLKQVAAMINLDMIGRLKENPVSVIGVESSPAWKKLLEGVHADYSLRLDTVGADFGGSDHQPFLAQEIPVLFFSTGLHSDYHLPSDTPEKIEAAGEVKLLRFLAETVAQVSRLTPRPAFSRKTDLTPPVRPSFRASDGIPPTPGLPGGDAATSQAACMADGNL